MAKYQSGSKVIQGLQGSLQAQIDDLQRQMGSLSKAELQYTAIRGDTYGKALVELRSSSKASLQPVFVQPDGSSISRPLSFAETIDARVNAYESGDKELFQTWLDTCTGVAYRAKTTEFKIVPVSPELVLLDKDFRQSFVAVDYQSQEGFELNIANGKYNVPLTKREVLRHPAWSAAVEDKALLKAYRDIIFKERRVNEAMGFWLRERLEEDQLRALCVYDLDLDSDAFDSGDLLDDSARFVRVSPK